MLYQRKHLADDSDVGDPAPLPAELVGLSDDSLADLGWTDASLGYQGDGFAPVAPPPPPPAPRRVGVRAFLRRFTGAELVAIEAASTDDPQLRVWRRILDAGDTVDLDHADVAEALAYLTTQALIANGRAAEITA